MFEVMVIGFIIGFAVFFAGFFWGEQDSDLPIIGVLGIVILGGIGLFAFESNAAKELTITLVAVPLLLLIGRWLWSEYKSDTAKEEVLQARWSRACPSCGVLLQRGKEYWFCQEPSCAWFRTTRAAVFVLGPLGSRTIRN